MNRADRIPDRGVFACVRVQCSGDPVRFTSVGSVFDRVLFERFDLLLDSPDVGDERCDPFLPFAFRAPAGRFAPRSSRASSFECVAAIPRYRPAGWRRRSRTVSTSPQATASRASSARLFTVTRAVFPPASRGGVEDLGVPRAQPSQPAVPLDRTVSRRAPQGPVCRRRPRDGAQPEAVEPTLDALCAPPRLVSIWCIRPHRYARTTSVRLLTLTIWAAPCSRRGGRETTPGSLIGDLLDAGRIDAGRLSVKATEGSSFILLGEPPQLRRQFRIQCVGTDV